MSVLGKTAFSWISWCAQNCAMWHDAWSHGYMKSFMRIFQHTCITMFSYLDVLLTKSQHNTGAILWKTKFRDFYWTCKKIWIYLVSIQYLGMLNNRAVITALTPDNTQKRLLCLSLHMDMFVMSIVMLLVAKKASQTLQGQTAASLLNTTDALISFRSRNVTLSEQLMATTLIQT